MASQDLIARLQCLDTCAVSDALDRLGLKGTVIGILAVGAGARIAGRVVTVKLGPKGQETPGRHLGTAAVEAAQPGDIIAVDHRGRVDVGGWGGILSVAAKVKGVAGVIIDGACRDVDEIRELGLPVYARGVVPLTARGRIVEHAYNEPIEIGGVHVRPGDFAIADGSGVVVLPYERAEEVISTAEEIAAREAEMAKAVLDGYSVAEVMGRKYETMLGGK